jgi:hypothetical protein
VSTNTTFVEIVRFQQSGLTEIQARTKAMGVEIGNASTKAETFARLLNDPRYAAFAKRMDGINKSYELLSLRARNVAATQRLADGSAVAHLRSVSQLNDKYAQMQRRAEAVAKYGERWGGIVAKYGHIGSAAGKFATGAAATGVGTVTALAHRGFEGTVELNKFSNEMTLLSREFAAAFKPLMTVGTKLARVTRVGMERLDTTGQNAVMWGTLGLGGALAARFAGVPVGGYALKAAGWGAGAAASGVGSAARYVGTAGRAIRGIPYLGTALTVADASTSGDYGRMRAAGKSRLASGAVAFGSSLADSYFSLAPWESSNPIREARAAAEAKDARARAAAPPPAIDHRRVTSAGGGWEEVGSAFERINAHIGEMSGPEDSSEEALGPLLKKLYDVLDRLEKWLQDKPSL